MRKFTTNLTLLILLILFSIPAFSAYMWIGGADIWSDPTKWDCMCVPGPGDHVIIPAGAVDLEGVDYTVDIVSLAGGTILAGGGGTLTVTGGMDWTGGTILADLTIAGASLDLSGPATKTLKAELTISFGSIVGWSDGTLLMDGGALFNSGTFVIESDHDIAEGGFLGSIDNDGVFVKTVGGATTDIDAFFENHFPGEVKVESGTLSFNKGFYNDYKMTIPVSGTLAISFDGTIDPGTDLTGVGKLHFSGDTTHYHEAYDGDIELEISGSAVLIPTVTVATTGDITIDDGVLDGSGTLTAKGTATWKEGTIGPDATFKIDAAGTLSISTTADKFIKGDVDLDGTTSWTGGEIGMFLGSEIDNSGIFSTDFNGSISSMMGPSAGTILNSGTIEKTAGGGTTEIEPTIDNAGSIEAKADTLSITSSFTNSGVVHATTASCNVSFSGGSTWATGSMMTGVGDIDFLGGTNTFSTAISSSNWIGFLGGTNTIDADLTNDYKVNLNSPATVNGSATLICEGELNYQGGTMDVSLSIESSGDIEIFSADTKTITADLTVRGEGYLYATATDFSVDAPGSITNLGTFYLEDGADIMNSGAAGSLSNGGTLVKNSLSTSTIDVDLSTSGTIKGIGTLAMAGAFINLGITEPGTSPGILTIDDDFSGGTQINIEMKDGTGAGTGHDQLIVTGTISLEDTLSVVETGTVPDGTYTIISCTGGPACLSGTFEQVSLPAGYSIAYQATEVTITKNSVLPVELLYFNALADGQDILLDWETASEYNNDYFQIERSPDGRNFTAIGVVSGAGSTAFNQRYFYVDKGILKDNILNTVYYRLKQIDLDGTYTFSEIVAVDLKPLEKPWSFTALPKSREHLQLIYNSQFSKKVRLSLFELSGKTVYQESIDIQKGVGILDLYPPNLVGGIYLVQIAAGRFQQTEQLFITAF